MCCTVSSSLRPSVNGSKRAGISSNARGRRSGRSTAHVRHQRHSTCNNARTPVYRSPSATPEHTRTSHCLHPWRTPEHQKKKKEKELSAARDRECLAEVMTLSYLQFLRCHLPLQFCVCRANTPATAAAEAARHCPARLQGCGAQAPLFPQTQLPCSRLTTATASSESGPPTRSSKGRPRAWHNGPRRCSHPLSCLGAMRLRLNGG